MTDTPAPETAAKTPWHLWVVGGVSLLWNGYGAYDYLMTQTGGEEYLRSYGMTDEQISYFSTMPAWSMATWAIGVWGAVLGSVLLLLRSKWALHAFIVSFAGFLGGLVYQFLLSNAAALMGPMAAVMSTVIGVACVFFIWYAWTMSKRGVLR